MKNLIIALCLVSTAAVAAETNAVSRVRRRPPRPSAGILERREAVPSKQIGVENRQKTVGAAQVEGIVQKARVMTCLPLVFGKGTSIAAVELVERDDATTLTLMPEDFKATVNVKALASDGAAPDVVASRLQKEVSRAALYLMGSGCALGDVTRPIRGLKELDGITFPSAQPETLTHLNAKNVAGVQLVRFASYAQACQEGWAPAPTNDIQKAIWEKVHAPPTKPMKITFDPAAQKGKVTK